MVFRCLARRDSSHFPRNKSTSGAGASEEVAATGGGPPILPHSDHSKVEGDVPVAQTYHLFIDP